MLNARPPRPNTPAQDLPTGPRFRVLLTEDRARPDEHWTRQVPALLRPLGVDARIASTGPEALDILKAGSIHAGRWADLTVRKPDSPSERFEPDPNTACLTDEWTYLRRVVRGECDIDPLSSLELNLIAVDILDRARRDARLPGE